MPGIRRWIFFPEMSLISRAKKTRRIWIDDEVHLYIGPKGVRFGPIFEKSADFFEKIFGGDRCGRQTTICGDRKTRPASGGGYTGRGQALRERVER
jgi:hypothetical protein